MIGEPSAPEPARWARAYRCSLRALFLAYGVIVPYFPVWLNSRGLDPLQISTITAAPLFVRVLFTPSVGLLADRLGNYRLVIVTLAWSTLALALGLSMVGGYGPILVVGVAYLLANGTMLPLIETVAVAGVRNAGLDYGRMRLWGSITFIVANFAGGVIIEALGGGSALWLMVSATVLTIAAAHALPAPKVARAAAAPVRAGGWHMSSPARLLRSRLFIALPRRHRLHARGARHVLHLRRPALAGAGAFGGVGRHAMGDRRHGRGGPVRLLGARRAPLRAGRAHRRRRRRFRSALDGDGVRSAARPCSCPLQLLHALTYGAAHLGAILFITRAVPHKGMGSAQAFYAVIAAGLGLGIVGLISGALYRALGGEVYFVPAVVSLIGCAAGIALLKGWNGGLLWPETSEAVPISPIAQPPPG